MHSSYFAKPFEGLLQFCMPYFMKTGDALGGIQELLTGRSRTMFQLPLIG